MVFSRLRTALRWASATAFAATLVIVAAPESARATGICDDQWPVFSYGIQVGKRKADSAPSTPLKWYDANRPWEPYEVAVDKYLYGDGRSIAKVVGQFSERTEAEAGLRELIKEHPRLYDSSYPPFIMLPGAYVATEKPTCRISLDNREMEKGGWILEKDGVVLVGAESACKSDLHTKKVVAISCDGKRSLITDKVGAPCTSSVRTCVHGLGKDTFLFEHRYSEIGGSQIHLRAWNVRTKKRVYALEWGHEGGPETELMRLEDVDKDGLPEIVFSIAGTSQVTKTLAWRNGKFLESKTK